MSNLQRAIDDVQKINSMFQGLLELGQELAKIDNIENHIKELFARKEALVNDIANLQDIQQFEADKNLAIAKQSLESEEMAKAEAAKIIGEAEMKAKSLLDSAQKEKEISASELLKIKDAFNDQYEIAQKALAEVKAEVESEQKRLDNIKAEIAKIKEL